jgi:hypothetical protein
VALGRNVREGGRAHQKSAAEQSDAENIHFCLPVLSRRFGLFYDDRNSRRGGSGLWGITQRHLAGRSGAVTDSTSERATSSRQIQDKTVVEPMLVREVQDEAERSRLWKLAVAAFPPYAQYQDRTARRIPVFVAEPT